jgi:hypothetical protein
MTAEERLAHLNGAYSRINRADEHLINLKTVAKEFLDAESKLAISNFQFDKQTFPPTIRLKRFIEIPPDVPILVGEIVYHLRSALDFLVYELAALDSGTPQNGTQFPIEDTPNGFKGRRRSYLRGVNDRHAALIEKLQPYNGVNWTKTLRSISNPDKHRRFTVSEHDKVIAKKTSQNAADVAIPHPMPCSNFESRIMFNIEITDTGKPPVYVQFDITCFVAFDDGTSIVKTLEILKSQVSDTIDAFKSEFK